LTILFFIALRKKLFLEKKAFWWLIILNINLKVEKNSKQVQVTKVAINRLLQKL